MRGPDAGENGLSDRNAGGIDIADDVAAVADIDG